MDTQNGNLRHEWILFLDADEFVTEAFVDEVAVKTLDPNYNGFTIQFENYFMGRKLKIWLWFSKVSSFKKSKGAYEKLKKTYGVI